MQGFLTELWQGVQLGLMGNRNQDWKAAGNQVSALPPSLIVGSMNLLKSPLFTNQLSWVLSLYIAKDDHPMAPKLILQTVTGCFWLPIPNSQESDSD